MSLQPDLPGRTLVMKFGGTSVGSPQAFDQLREIVQQARMDWAQLVVVVSALSGVTNQLLESARMAVVGDGTTYQATAKTLTRRHGELLEYGVPDARLRKMVMAEIERLVADFTALCQAIQVLGEATPRALDAVAALGERMSVRVIAAGLVSAGLPAQAIDATALIAADASYQAAHPDLQRTRQNVQQRLEPRLVVGQVPVITGFIAAAPDGSTVTLGRGGSDYSAAILAACLPADELWIWTDVDGVKSADPRLIAEACTIPRLTFKEVGELAYFGAKVLHPKSIRPVIEAGIGLRVCNTFNPEHPGTWIVTDPLPGESQSTPAQPEAVVKAVTVITGLTLVTLEGRGMLGVPGVAARTFAAVAATGTSVPMISQASSEQSICFAVPLERTPLILARLEEEFSREIGKRDIDRVWATGELVILTAVGAGMRHTAGVAGRLFSALGKAGVNVIAIAQGSSEVSVSILVAAADMLPGLQALHTLVLSCGDD
jgi:aspartate kinase